MQYSNRMLWTSPRAIFLLTVLTEHSAQNHDCSILVYLPSWQHLSFVHVEELKLAIGFQLHSHLYTSKLTSDLVTCKIWSNFFSMNFTASIRGLFAIGLLGTLCGGAFYSSCECYLSWTEIVSNWEKVLDVGIALGVHPSGQAWVIDHATFSVF